jgi:hypothetical protein
VAHSDSERNQTENSRRISVLVVGIARNEAYKLFRVCQAKDDSIYFIAPLKGERFYFSRHSSGQFRFVAGRLERAEPLPRQPLSTFKGMEQLGFLAFSPNHLDKENDLNKTHRDLVLFLDLSQLHTLAKIECFLVEQGRVDLLIPLTKPADPILAITTTRPWVVLRVGSFVQPSAYLNH